MADFESGKAQGDGSERRDEVVKRIADRIATLQEHGWLGNLDPEVGANSEQYRLSKDLSSSFDELAAIEAEEVAKTNWLEQ